jgi:hypothetical protein
VTDRLLLLASPDDYLLAERLAEAVETACRDLGVDHAEHLPDGVTPEAVAVELENRSLFTPRRVLVVRDAAPLLDSAAGRRGGGTPSAEPLVQALASGVPDDLALVMAARCDAKPGGDLVAAITRYGSLQWIPVPPAPKPWEEAVLSAEQVELLRSIMRRAVPNARFTPAAESTLLDRLGFAPRLLVEETRKLAMAAGPDGTVDEELVLRLAPPQEWSLNRVHDAVLARDPGPVMGYLAAAAAGLPVNDRRGQRLDSDGVAPAVLGTVAGLLEKLLDLRLLAGELGLAAELAPARTRADRWYQRVFKPRLAPALEARLAEDGDASPLNAPKPTGTWNLGRYFAAAGRYREEELVAALSRVGSAAVQVRGELPLEAVLAWVGPLLEPAPMARRGPSRGGAGSGR